MTELTPLFPGLNLNIYIHHRRQHIIKYPILKCPQSVFLSFCDNVSHQYKITCNIIVLYIVLFKFQERTWNDKRF